MTELTDDQVKALLDGDPEVWTWQSCENSQGWNTKFGAVPPKPGPHIGDIMPLYAAPAPDLARALLDARAELDTTQTQVGDWIVRADEAKVKVEKLEAELARVRADAAEHERLMAERDAEIARMRDARILVLPGGLTGVCVGSRFGGWLMRRHPDGQWVSVVKLQEVDPNPEARSSAGDVARAALGDDNG